MVAALAVLLGVAVSVTGCEKDPSAGGGEGTTSGHPILMLKNGDETKIKSMVSSNPKMRLVQQKVYGQANAAIKVGPSKYELKGKRLLDVSRKSLQNLFSLSYAYRMSKNSQYLDAAVAELNAVCAFPDWNPSHYLDVAEMCLGVAIAYDWLYDVLPVSTRAAAENAIEKMALDTGLSERYNGSFLNSGGNWNQVCSAGLLCGALAIQSKTPEKSQRMIDMCRLSIRKAVDAYNPDGAYAEGPGYWAYGTDFNIIFNYVERMLGTEPYITNGFKKSAYYYLNVVAPSAKRFNYSDCDSKVSPDIPQFYFAGITGDNSLLWWDMKLIDTVMDDNRLLPALLVFAKDIDLSQVKVPADKVWTGGGNTPVYFARTSWSDSNASFMGVKGGRAQDSHSHLDAGSFIFEADGVRWGIDYGNENYTNVENAGVSLWSMGQNSPRWGLLAYNNKQHNTITLGGENLLVAGRATISSTVSESGKNGVVMDLTPCYKGVTSVIRQSCLYDDGSMETVDAVNPQSDVEYCWTMISDTKTTADVSGSTVVLYNNGKSLRLAAEVVSSSGASSTSSVASAEIKAAAETFSPKTSYESARGLRTTFKVKLPADTQTKIKVTLKPIN